MIPVNHNVILINLNVILVNHNVIPSFWLRKKVFIVKTKEKKCERIKETVLGLNDGCVGSSFLYFLHQFLALFSSLNLSFFYVYQKN